MSTLAHLLKAHVERHPERVSIILQHAGQEDRPITYGELLNGAYSFALTLRRAGIQPGEVVVLILQHGIELIFSFFGSILYGAIPSIMPFLTEKLSPERYRADLQSLIQITRPAAIVTYAEFLGEVERAITPDGPLRAILSSSDFEPVAGEADFSWLPGLRREESEIVLLQHSSGTTGLQKGVALSHRAVLNQLQAYSEAIALSQEDVIVSWLPLYHDMGLIAGFIMPVMEGVLLVLMSPFDWVRAPQRLFQAVSRYRGTLTWLPNFAYHFCAQKVRDVHLSGVDLSSWRAVINCSEPVRWESHQAFYERFKRYGLRYEALQSSYAMAENVFGVTQSPMGKPPATDRIDREAFLTERVARPALEGRASLVMMSSGRPLRNTRLRILDEHGHDLPERVVGEIAIQSDCMLNGYFNRPDLTRKAFRNGWYLTGDLGYLADGELYVAGRKKDLIIVGGKNIYPQDLEALAGEVPGVHPGRVVAFGIFNETLGTEEVAIVAEVDTEDPLERERIEDAIRLHVTRNSAIAVRYVRAVGARWLIKTSSGKIARAANREKFLRENGLSRESSPAP
uniref:AMP-dependent synthetase and ligase n=1 Tax=uncultured Chloroflexota bacterium TaxID=166587 RepID=H5SFP1_9CHLR|nr:AMP-dependent synthetase and ligase [uncultured Chloroflexota bacterium]